MKWKNSILTKMFIGIIIPIILILTVSSGLILRNVKHTVSEDTNRQLKSESDYASLEVAKFFDKYLEITKQVAATHVIEDLMINVVSSETRINTSEKFIPAQRILVDAAATDKEGYILALFGGDFSSSQLFQSDGYVGDKSFDVTTRPWYKVSSTKEPLLVSPYEDLTTKKLVFTVAVPVFENESNKVIGAIGTDLPLDAVTSKFHQHKLGETGFFILISDDGQIVYHPSDEYLNTNISQSNLSPEAISAIQSNTNGKLEYEMNGEKIYGYLSTVPGTNWSVLTGLPEKEYFQSYSTIRNIVFLIFGFGVLAMIAILIIISKGIVNPLKKLSIVANQIADGELDIIIDSSSKDETGQVAIALDRTVARLKDYIVYIDEITSILEQIAIGNLCYELKYDYVGEFSKVKDALLKVSDTLTETLSQVDVASDQVANGSDQIASGAQALSQGATEQASSIEELAAVINELSSHITKNAQNSIEGNGKAELLASEIMTSNDKMQRMIEAMNEISETSNEIGKIIKTIEDIAFQTNILALNAAVEAARAGNAGKGFAVVADEVRNLAGKSAEAARNTTALIEKSMKAVSDGTVIADETAHSLNTVVTNAHEVTETINKITLATEEQSHSIQEINLGIEQVSSVVQTNSATAEESAAASQELSSQAQMLKDLMDHFVLNAGKDVSYKTDTHFDEISDDQEFDNNMKY